ncbi:hypothetical protein [Aeromicrobium sp. 179-A 4D2 NHS]|uniref:hypothetical protein n=1 Tax=Aeromicrobium sp. 179-A 4D2 NHS TaxID=3142375 RepID=UPI00399F5640
MSEFRPNDDALLRVKVTEVSGSSVEVSIPTRPAPEYLTVNVADLLARDVPGRDEIVDEHAESVFTSLASPVQTGRSEAEIKALDLLEQALLWRVNGMGGVPLDEIRAWDVAAEGLLRAVRVAATEGSK